MALIYFKSAPLAFKTAQNNFIVFNTKPRLHDNFLRSIWILPSLDLKILGNHVYYSVSFLYIDKCFDRSSFDHVSNFFILVRIQLDFYYLKSFLLLSSQCLNFYFWKEIRLTRLTRLTMSAYFLAPKLDLETPRIHFYHPILFKFSWYYLINFEWFCLFPPVLE